MKLQGKRDICIGRQHIKYRNMEEETPLESPMVPLPASRDPADGCREGPIRLTILDHIGPSRYLQVLIGPKVALILILKQNKLFLMILIGRSIQIPLMNQFKLNLILIFLPQPNGHMNGDQIHMIQQNGKGCHIMKYDITCLQIDYRFIRTDRIDFIDMG